MNEHTQTIALLFVTGFAAGFINIMAGGGSSLTLPTLIFLGLDAAMANGTNRIAILIQNISAVASFKKEKFSQFKISFKMALLTLPGGIFGAMLAVNLSNELFKTILGAVMIGIVVTMLIPRKKIEETFDAEAPLNWKIYLAMFGIGFYGGFIQVGVGFLLMAALYYLLKLNLTFVNMHKVFIVLIFTIPSLFIFAYTDNIDWPLGLSLAAGNATGAWWSAKLAIKKGEKIIRHVLVMAIIIMASKLLGLF